MSEGAPRGSFFLPSNPTPAERLRDPGVQNFFLGVLQSDVPSEEKYEKFVQFFELESILSRKIASRSDELVGEEDEEKIQEILATAAEEVGVWEPRKILAETEDCLRRAVRRLLVSQHHDGGWGYQPEVSSIWATVYGVLALHLAEPHRFVDADLRAAHERGLDWLMGQRAEWSVEEIPPRQERSIYELSAVIVCMCETGRNRDPAVRRLISTCIERLHGAQNQDGGWDRSLWGAEWPGPTGKWSETGATSFALQALAVAGGEASKPVVANGIDALVSTQNDDGSWNIMIAQQLLDRGPRTVTKTCDALKGILVAARIDIDIDPYKDAIARGVDYLMRREQPIYSDARTIAGWGWFSEELSTLENTCHTLETLLWVENASIPLLTSNASWLIRSQYEAHDSLEDGKWVNNDTGRIALSLVCFYNAIKASPLFTAASDNG